MVKFAVLFERTGQSKVSSRGTIPAPEPGKRAALEEAPSELLLLLVPESDAAATAAGLLPAPPEYTCCGMACRQACTESVYAIECSRECDITLLTIVRQ